MSEERGENAAQGRDALSIWATGGSGSRGLAVRRGSTSEERGKSSLPSGPSGMWKTDACGSCGSGRRPMPVLLPRSCCSSR